MAGEKAALEPILDPELPIIDSHHHLWLMASEVVAALHSPDNPFAAVMGTHARYLFDDYVADLGTGHNIVASVYVEAHAMHRKDGPEHMRSVGEVEFASGAAAMAASGHFGKTKICAGIVSEPNLRLGDAVEEVLEAHIQAGGGRLRGVRNLTAYDADPVLAGVTLGTPPHLLLDKTWRAGFKYLQKMGLSYDVWALEPQLPEVIDLARSFPDTQIILNHVGTPVGRGSYTGTHQARYGIWQENMRTLATCPNVAVKLGGLGMPVCGFPSFNSNPDSETLAAEWRPYIEPTIETFGVDRCMFESNYPAEAAGGAFPVIWNAFKRITAGASDAEKTALFSGTASRIYKLEL